MMTIKNKINKQSRLNDIEDFNDHIYVSFKITTSNNNFRN